MTKIFKTVRVNVVICGALLVGAVSSFAATPRSAFRITEEPSARAANERSSIASVREAAIEVDEAAFRSGQH